MAATSNFSPNSFTARTTSSAASCHCRSRARAHAPLYSAARASSCAGTRSLHARRALQSWPALTRLAYRLKHGQQAAVQQQPCCLDSLATEVAGKSLAYK